MPAWYDGANEGHDAARHKMVARIVRFLRKRRPRASPAWLAKLPVIAEYLEKWLFQHSSSFNEYRNKKTIPERINALVGSIKGKLQRASLSENPQAVFGEVEAADLRDKGSQREAADDDDETAEDEETPDKEARGDVEERIEETQHDDNAPKDDETPKDTQKDDMIAEDEVAVAKNQESSAAAAREEDEVSKTLSKIETARELARQLDRRALLAKRAGKFEAAESLYRLALETREEVLGPRHTEVATTLNKLGLLLKTDRPEEALPCFERALSARGEALGPCHRKLATILCNIGSVHYARGSFDEAETLYSRALFIREHDDDAQGPELAATLNNVAAVLVARWSLETSDGSREDLHRAATLYERALRIYDTLPGHHHMCAKVLENFGLLLTNLGRPQDAEPLLQRARHMQQTVAQENNTTSHALMEEIDEDQDTSPGNTHPIATQATSPKRPDKDRILTSFQQPPTPNRQLRPPNNMTWLPPPLLPN